MEASDLAAVGYASQMLAFAVLSALFLCRRLGSPFSRYLAAASAASSLLGGVLALQTYEVIPFGIAVVLAEWARNILWIVALLMVLRALDSRRLAEIYARRYVLPGLAVVLICLVIYSGRNIDSYAVSMVIGGGVLMGVMLISLLEQIHRKVKMSESMKADIMGHRHNGPASDPSIIHVCAADSALLGRKTG